MVLLDVGRKGVPRGAVGTRSAARGCRRGLAPTGGTDGPTVRAGHGGLDPQGAVVSQADASKRRAEDVSTGLHTRSVRSGTIAAAAGVTPPNSRPKGHGGGGRVYPTPGTHCADGCSGFTSCRCRS